MGAKASVVCVALLALAGCAGYGDDAAERSTVTEPSAESPVRDVVARVGGRTLDGHCRGRKRHDPAVMLEVGMAVDAGQNQLAALERRLAERTVVCAYDRAGVGASDPPPTTPRPVTDAVADAEAFAAATGVAPPYVLVGFSAGGAIAFMHAQAEADDVVGLVVINPVPPAKTFLERARRVETKSELASEQAFFHRAANDERIVFTATERMLTDPLPATMPYAVVFDEDCDGDAALCRRILPALTQVTRMLANVGARGRFVPAPGAGHDVFETRPQLVYETVDRVLVDARG